VARIAVCLRIDERAERMSTISKAAYAAFLFDEPEPLKAAMLMCPDDVGLASWYAIHWATDPEVVDELNRLKGKENNVQTIASKYDLARFYWNIANDPNIEARDRLNAAEKYGAVAGIYDPKATNNNTVNMSFQRVVAYVDHGDDDEWAIKAEAQQRALVNGRYVAKN
jgi:hypothetical protein